MKFLMFLECLVGRHDWGMVYDMATIRPVEKPYGRMCRRCGKLEKFKW